MARTVEGGSREITIPADLSEAERSALLDTHPIIERLYIVPTPMMERAYAIIRDRVWARRTGACFYATPRVGKSRCAVGIKAMLETEFPKAFVVLISAGTKLQKSDGRIFSMILRSENHALSGRKDGESLFENALADIEVKTKSRAGTQFVLLVDEMQNLTDFDLHRLAYLHNILEQRRIKMTTISFAQPEIVHRRSALLASNDRHIIGRFLTELVPYSGCSGVGDFRIILRSYDETSEYPEGSGISFTLFFLPIAYQSGFRLQSYAAAIWSELARAGNVDRNGMVPMEHASLTIETLLLWMRKEDCSNLTLSAEDIFAAVAESQLDSFCTVLGPE